MTSDVRGAEPDVALAADFRALFDTAGIGMARIESRTRRIVTANAALATMTGYSAEELVGMTTDDLLHPDDTAAGTGLYTATVAAGAASGEARFRAKDGQTVWVCVEAALVRDADGKARRTIALIHDRTASVAAVARANDDRERTHLALAAANAGAWEFRIGDRQLIWSPELRALYDLPADAPDPDYRAWRTLIHADDAEVAEPPLATIVDDAYETEFRAWIGDDWRWLGSRARIVRDGSGAPSRVVGINIDQTAARAAAEAMAAAVARFGAAVAAIAGVLWTNSAAGEMHGDQPAWSALTGQSAADYADFGWTAAIHPDDAEPTLAAWQAAVVTTTPFVFEHRVRVADGCYRWFSVRALPVVTEGVLREWVGVHTDIDAVKLAEAALKGRVADAVAARETALAQLHEAQKLETIGQLTGGVAHDFNNLLTPIIGSLDLIARRADDPRTLRLIDGALTAAERAKTLVQRLLAFSRRQTLATRAVNIATLVGDLHELLARAIGPGIALDVADNGEDYVAEVDPAQLELALLNLALNARDAMAGSGHLTITLARERGPPTLADGDYIRLTAADTGSGMDAETLRRAIEPFFTTKPIGRGTGLGLSMVHGLAAQSGGLLTLDSTPGTGTRAHLWLPAAAGAATPADPSRPTAPLHHRTLTILLVDDEPLVRAATAAMLADLGHRVVEADDPIAAVGIARDTAIDLVVSDYLMPGMNGAALIAEIRAVRPALPALVVTGFTERDTVEPGLVQLAKPFRQSELAAALDRAVSAANIS